MYRSINKILISLALFCAGINPCMAQLVGPDDKPDAPTAVVAKIGVTEYTSVEKAFEAANSGQTDPVTINLLMGVTLKEAIPLEVSKNITLRLHGKQLSGSQGITATVADGATLALREGTLSGSLVWEGTGRLFAGADVDLSALSVTKGAVKLYRVLLKLPAGAGTVKDIYYGKDGFTTFAQSGEIICCWLPLHTAAQDITLNDDGKKRYLASNVVVTTHASTPLEATLNVAPDVDIAEVTKINETNSTKHKTLVEAFKALETAEGEVKLRSNASFAESLSILQAVNFELNGKILTASYGAEFAATGSGNLHIKDGVLSGTFAVTGDVVADQSVAMAGVNVIDGKTKTAVYRVRLTLPSLVQGKTLSFTYGAKTDVAIPRTFTESNMTTAYIWLPAESSAQSFTLKAAGSTDEVVVKNNVTINANHDNHINLTIGDNVAKLIVASGSPTETLYTSFHDALEAAAALTGTINCKIELLANVTLNGTSGHAHSTQQDQLVTIDLNGHNLTGENCWLQATESNSAYILTDSRKTGSLTGQLQINGNIYITEDIAASKIGQIVKQGSAGTPLYRLMATLSTQGALADGFVTYQLDGSGTPSSCYMKGNKVCLFLPSGANQHTLEVTENSELYSASNIMISASHSNVATLRLPTEVAKIGTTKYKTLADALTAAQQQQSPVTIELLNQATLSGKHTISKNLTIDLKEFTLKMEGAVCEWAVNSGSSLYIKSTPKTATIQGDFTVSEDVCISADVAISGSVKKGSDQVYRTRFYLPSGTTAATYTFNNQKGSLIFPGETRTNGQAVGYAFLQVESGHHDLKVEITAPSGGQNIYELKQVFLQAFHNNQFDMEAGANVAQVSNTKFTLFSAALAVANASGGTIELLRDLSLSGVHSITNDVMIDLKGYTLNTTDDANFNITDSKTLIIKDSNTSPGSLYGLLRMQGGTLFVAPEVKIAGTVVRGGEELYRCLATGIGTYTGTTTYGLSQTAAIQNGTACFWLPPVTVEHDLAFQADRKSYEVTLQPALPNHNNSVQAYPVVIVDANTIWSNADNKEHNVYIKEGVRLEIEDASGITNLHRVVMEKGAEIVCQNAILATAGIIYRHEFTRAKTWEAFSLPYHARLVRMTSSTQQKEVRPYQIDGTGGDFWLKTIAPEGRFDYVTEERIMANTGYIIAVPEELTSHNDKTLRIDFVSATDQFLNRKAAALPEPKAGEFVQTASGMLCKMKLERPFYQLNVDGTEYKRVDATTTNPADILPFSSFLLSDSKTLATYSTLRMGNLPTAVDRPLLPDLTVRVTGVAGGVRIESERETTLQVYTLMGRLICLNKIAAGTTFLPLQPGLYIVNREKVVVR